MTEAVKHTPGPWQIEDHGSLYVSTMHPVPVFELVPLVGLPDEHRANARLIAAAPELLEAAKRLEAEFGLALNKKTMEAVHFARSAIAKAEGRS